MEADIYLHQIQLAQEFLNENSQADISRLQCLLRKIMPQKYHTAIDNIKLKSSSPVTINLNDGQNVIAPNAITAEQHIHKQPIEDHTKVTDTAYTAKEIDSIVQKHHNYEWGIIKLQELNADGEEENKLIDEYINEVLDEGTIISLIKNPKSEAQAFALLEAVLTTDRNSLIKKLLRTSYIKNCTDPEKKALLYAAIERLRS